MEASRLNETQQNVSNNLVDHHLMAMCVSVCVCVCVCVYEAVDSCMLSGGELVTQEILTPVSCLTYCCTYNTILGAS